MQRFSSNVTGLLMGCVMVVMLSACGEMLSVPPLQNADNNAVVNIGDSIFALSGDIYTDVHAKAGQTFRHYAVTGTQMIGEILGPSIPKQYELAKIDTIYMNGGGNDVLLPALMGDPNKCKTCNYFWCPELSQTCKDSIDDVYVERVDLLNKMAEDGVSKVVYLGYYLPTTGLFGDLTTLAAANVYGNATIKKGCENARVDCVFLNPTNAFKGHESDYITCDGIHPTDTGSKVLADMIWDELGKLVRP